MATKDFHLGDVLSVTTGNLLSPEGIGGVYKILNWMTGESMFTHQIPRIIGEARQVVLRQHPQLADVDASGVNGDNFRQWLGEQVARFGEVLPIEPMTADEHEYREPMSELAEKAHPDRIIPVVAE